MTSDKDMRRGLFIGVNAYRSVTKLNGCVNDAHHLGLIFKALGFRVRLLADDRAYRENILERVKWVTDVHPDGFWVIGFSGHGTQRRDRDGDELSDSYDELICPFDLRPSTYWDTGMIVDDEWRHLLPDGKPAGLAIFDCCHSGTSLRGISPVVNQSSQSIVLNRGVSQPVDIAFRSMMVGEGESLARSSFKSQLSGGGPVYYIGASQDRQTAVDYYEGACPICKHRPQMILQHGSSPFFHGALSSALIDFLFRRLGARYSESEGVVIPEGITMPTFKEVRKGVQDWIGKRRNRFTQIPSFERYSGVPDGDPLPLVGRE